MPIFLGCHRFSVFGPLIAIVEWGDSLNRYCQLRPDLFSPCYANKTEFNFWLCAALIIQANHTGLFMQITFSMLRSEPVIHSSCKSATLSFRGEFLPCLGDTHSRGRLPPRRMTGRYGAPRLGVVLRKHCTATP